MDASLRTSRSEPALAGLRGPRWDILLELKRSPDRTARELGRALGYSLNGVRHHLKELEAEGLVVYRLTAAADGLFPRRYEATLIELLDHVVAEGGREAAVRVLEAHYTALAKRLDPALEGLPSRRRLDVIAQALSDEGYMAESKEQQPGSFATLVEHNCAVKAVAERFPEICQAEARFLESTLGVPVERRSHMLAGCGACEYLVRLEPATHERENR